VVVKGLSGVVKGLSGGLSWSCQVTTEHQMLSGWLSGCCQGAVRDVVRVVVQGDSRITFNCLIHCHPCSSHFNLLIYSIISTICRLC